MLKIKDQIAYIPHHAKGDIRHKDVEFGFVTKPGTSASFCRFWLKGQPGKLRTTSCSERAYNECLKKYSSCTDGEVDLVYKGIKAQEKKYA